MALLVLVFAFVGSGQAQSLHGDRARECLGQALEGVADFALAHEIEAWGSQVMVRRGELFVCDPSCASWGRVEMLASQRREEARRFVRVVPSDRPSVVETWSVVGGVVQVLSRESRASLDGRRSPFGREPSLGPSLASWPLRRAAELDALAAEGVARFGEVSIQGVRTPGGVAGIATEHSGNAIAAVAFVRRGAETFRSCVVREEIGGGIGLEDALEARPLGEDLGAVFLRVRIGRQGYDYDMGAWTELWALVPAARGRLSLSYAVIADWLGTTDRETGDEEWRGWVSPLRTMGLRTLRFGRRERWTLGRAGSPVRDRDAESGAPRLVELDEHGFVSQGGDEPL